MATILLSAAGAAVGGMTSGTVLGLSGAVIGRAVGATLGRAIDQRLLGTGSDAVERGRIDRFRVTGASEGAPIAQLFGRMRLGGQVIWATNVLETVTTTGGGGGGGKGAPKQPKTTTYSYSVSLAVSVCEGEIRRIGRVWADGVQVDRSTVTMRVYTGADDQMPDPLLEAVEGAGQVPAYRGLAYVVFEDLDLGPFGNRIPQFAFEVSRAAEPARDLTPAAADLVRAVAMMPGTGEYVFATTPVTYDAGFGRRHAANVSSEGGGTDFTQSLAQMRATLPNLKSVSLIYSWFGDDLRAGACTVRPKVEDAGRDGAEMAWRAGGINRWQAAQIARVDGRPVYGGTPADTSVIQAIQALRNGGQEVVFYPFLLMEILEGNGRPNPWGDGAQPALPWRGRITGDVAPGLPGTTDGTPANAAAVSAFFGAAKAHHFSIHGGVVSYSGPADWSYSRFILHSAALCAAAGGVEAFCIGSEMRALTQMRDTAGFPAVAAFRALAAQVRQLLPHARLSYAADWSEYFGYHPQDGSGDAYFYLDPLWADDNIDFVAIDNYMPLSDWRDGLDHADADWDIIHSLDYLRSNIEGGEGFEWYYPDADARAAQERVPITDGLAGEDWVYRYKDLRGWWDNVHRDRRRGELLADILVVGATYDGAFASGDAYWMAGFNEAEGAFPSAPGLTHGDSNAQIVSVDGEGLVLELRDSYRTISERGWRVFEPQQSVRLTLRTRLLAEPSDGQPHTHRAWMARVGADGRFGGISLLAVWEGLTVQDGWVERQITFAPEDLRAMDGSGEPAKGWRVVVGLNGWTANDPTGAVQQIAQIHVEAEGGRTAWVPQSKPIVFTEIGCAAVDKGTNQPNKFLDPKSSETALPYFSSGRRDDLIQAQYLRAIMSYWSEPGRNPVSDVYGGPMLDMDRAHVWAWDARPWPAFPNDQNRWSDGENWTRGHWVTGRIEAVPLEHVVAELCEAVGMTDYDVSGLAGLVRGHLSGDTETARARLQALMVAYGFQAVERDGKVVFLPVPRKADALIEADWTALNDDGAGGLTEIRASEAETTGRVRVRYSAAEGQYDERVAEAVFPGDGDDAVSASELPLALTGAEAHAVAERWLAEARVARDTVRFHLPPSARALGAGAMVALPDASTWRIDRIEDRGTRAVEASRVEPTVSEPSDAVEELVPLVPFAAPVPVSAVFMDLPLLTGEEVEHAPHLAVTATPWPGSVAVYGSSGPDGFLINRLIERGAIAGSLKTPLAAARAGLWDRSAPMRVEISGGALSGAEMSAVLNGANVAAIGSGDEGPWEIIQFADATLVGPDTWDIGLRLRGQQGTDAVMPEVWPVGSIFVLLDGGPAQVTLQSSARGLARHWRIGPAQRSLDDPSFIEKVVAFQGVGLRPYAPVHLRAARSGADQRITWIRRSRVDADSWEGMDVPLGETSEQYLLRVSDDTGLRREDVLSTPEFTYTAAMRASDGVASPYHITVAQISERFGPGPFARIDLHD
ncbi:MAG: glycoside hydrolase TIM-barrel-like domain-containing protein [Pseudomonadota bacterium]